MQNLFLAAMLIFYIGPCTAQINQTVENNTTIYNETPSENVETFVIPTESDVVESSFVLTALTQPVENLRDTPYNLTEIIETTYENQIISSSTVVINITESSNEITSGYESIPSIDDSLMTNPESVKISVTCTTSECMSTTASIEEYAPSLFVSSNSSSILNNTSSTQQDFTSFSLSPSSTTMHVYSYPSNLTTLYESSTMFLHSTSLNNDFSSHEIVSDFESKTEHEIPISSSPVEEECCSSDISHILSAIPTDNIEHSSTISPEAKNTVNITPSSEEISTFTVAPRSFASASTAITTDEIPNNSNGNSIEKFAAETDGVTTVAVTPSIKELISSMSISTSIIESTSNTSVSDAATDLITTPTIEPTLNTSAVLSEYWVITVLIVPINEDVSSYIFVNDMETRLANLFDQGYSRAKKLESNILRSKRAVTSNNVTIQVTNITREEKMPETTNIIYYMETYGNITEAKVLIELMSLFRIQEVALALDREVVVKAQLYTEPPAPEPEPDRKLWIIGVVFGSLIFLIGCCWLILFIYFKCTRPAQRKRSPRTSRFYRAEPYTPEGSLTKGGFKPNEVKGFDVVRTEVGLENEIHLKDRKSTEIQEPYRRRDGSTELEGMYSTGEGVECTPERKATLPSPIKDKRIKQINLESENDTEERQTDMSEDRLPLSPPKLRKIKKGKKKHNKSHRGKGKKHADGKEAPKPKIRSSIHPAPSGSRGNDDDDDEEEMVSPVLVIPPGTAPDDMEGIRRSLKTKAEIERQNNKRRQRSLKSDELVPDRSDPIAMKRLQRELDSILDPSSAHSSLGSAGPDIDVEIKDPKHTPLYLENFVLKKKNDSNVWNAYNASDEAAHITKQGISVEGLKHISQISFDSDDNDSMGSGGVGRRGRVSRSAEYSSPRLTSMLFAAQRSSGKGKKPFHLPHDDYTSIRMSTSVIAPESKRGKRDSEQSDSGRYSSDDNHDSLNGGNVGTNLSGGNPGTSLQEAYLITDGRTTSLEDGYLVQHVCRIPVLNKSSSVDSPRPSSANLYSSEVKHSRVKPNNGVESSDDEVDIAHQVMTSKEPAAPIVVTSLRQELHRMAQKSPRSDTSITKF